MGAMFDAAKPKARGSRHRVGGYASANAGLSADQLPLGGASLESPTLSLVATPLPTVNDGSCTMSSVSGADEMPMATRPTVTRNGSPSMQDLELPAIRPQVDAKERPDGSHEESGEKKLGVRKAENIEELVKYGAVGGGWVDFADT